MSSFETEDWVTVQRSFFLGEAELLASWLRAAGIPVRIKNELSALCIGPVLATGGFLLQVPNRMKEEALQLLRTAKPQESYGHDQTDL